MVKSTKKVKMRELEMPLCVRAQSGVFAKTHQWFFYSGDPDLYVTTDAGQTVKMSTLVEILGDPDPLVSVLGLRLRDVLENFEIRYGCVHVP